MDAEFREIFEKLIGDVISAAMDYGGWMVGSERLDIAVEKLTEAVEQKLEEK